MDLKDKRIWWVLAILAGLAIIAFAMTAEKAAAANWSGCYAGGNVGYGSTNTDADISAGGASIGIESLGMDGATVSPTIGCDMQMQRFVVGVFGDYTWHNDSEFVISASAPPFVSGDVFSWEVENEWSIGGRAGYLLTDDVLAYGLVAYSKMETSDISSPAFGASFDVSEFEGWALGGGVNVALGNGLFATAEYRYTDYDSETVNLAPGFDLDLDPDVQSARVGAIYKFNFSQNAIAAPLK